MRLRLIGDHMDGLKPQGMAEILLVLLHQGSLIKGQLQLQHLQKDSRGGVKWCTCNGSNLRGHARPTVAPRASASCCIFLAKGRVRALMALGAFPWMSGCWQDPCSCTKEYNMFAQQALKEIKP